MDNFKETAASDQKQLANIKQGDQINSITWSPCHKRTTRLKLAIQL